MKLEPAQILQLMNLLLKALGTRVLCMVALLMTFALFVSAMWKGSLLEFEIAGTFAIGVFWPALASAFFSTRGDDDGKS